MKITYADIEPTLIESGFNINIQIPRSRIFRYFGCTLDEIQEYEDVKSKLFGDELVIGIPNDSLLVIVGEDIYFKQTDWFEKMKPDLVIEAICFNEETMGRGLACSIE